MKTPKTFICHTCNKEFTDHPSSIRIYCSRKCLYEAQSKKFQQESKQNWIKRICLQCGKEFSMPPWRIDKNNPGKFCSKTCHYLSRTSNSIIGMSKNYVEKICKECGKKFIISKSKLKNSPYNCCSLQCSRINSKKEARVVKKCKMCEKEFFITKSHAKSKSGERKHSGIFCSKPCRYQYMKGKNSGTWKLDRTKLASYAKNKNKWNRDKYGMWSNFSLIYKKKHNLTCMLTRYKANKSNEVETHHIIAVNINPELCFEESNLICIKRDIHLHFHHLYGNHVTGKEWNDYLSKYYPDKIEEHSSSNIIIFNKDIIQTNIKENYGK